MECERCGGRLSSIIGMTGERRKVCYGCGAQVWVESWAEDTVEDAPKKCQASE